MCWLEEEQLTVEQARDPEDDILRRICELQTTNELSGFILARFATSTGKSAFGLRLSIGNELFSWRPHGGFEPRSRITLMAINDLCCPSTK